MQCIVKLPVVSNSDFGLTTAHGAAEDQEWVLKSERIRYRCSCNLHHQRDSMTRPATWLSILMLMGLGLGCGNPPPTHSADVGVDAPAVVRPVGISGTVWTTVQKFSPEEFEPPTDSTNAVAQDPRAQRLGQFLFFETRISGEGEVSCASCHDPQKGFADGEPVATAGVGGVERPTARHTPSILNTGAAGWYFWDGRVDTLWGQAIQPIENPVEMGSSRVELAHFIYDEPEVRRAYEELFGSLPPKSSVAPFPARGRPIEDPQTPTETADAEAWDSMTAEGQNLVNTIAANVGKAMAAYEMQLVSLDSPFDRYVDQLRQFPEEPEKWDAIDDDAKEGIRLFIEVVGCVACHKGPLLTDDKFHNIGLPERDAVDSYDIGRWDGLAAAKDDVFSSAGPFSDDPEGNRAQLLFALPQQPADKGAFRTPSLRNLTKTGPYMHGGHFETLREVMDFYNSQPDGVPLVGVRDGEVSELQLEEEHIDALQSFLEALDGQPVPQELTVKPPSPVP